MYFSQFNFFIFNLNTLVDLIMNRIQRKTGPRLGDGLSTRASKFWNPLIPWILSSTEIPAVCVNYQWNLVNTPDLDKCSSDSSLLWENKTYTRSTTQVWMQTARNCPEYYTRTIQ
jgi:hypothetical protein